MEYGLPKSTRKIETEDSKIMNKKEILLGYIEDAVADLLYYNRRNDEDLSIDDITDLLGTGEVTIKELVNVFETELLHVFIGTMDRRGNPI